MSSKTSILVLLSILINITLSCTKEKDFEFQEPYLSHASLLNLNSNVKRVTYERKNFSPTEGGYFPSDRNKEYYSKLFDYPYSSSDLRYMGNLNINMINNFPITANQYLLNELILMDMLRYDVSIEFRKGKIISYSCKVDGYTNTLECIYNKDNRLIELFINSKETIKFKHKGSFLKEAIFISNTRNDTITFNHKLIKENHIQITSNKDLIDVYLKTDPNGKIPILGKITSKNRNETIKYSKGKLHEAFKEKDNKYETYKSFNYRGNQITSMLRKFDGERSIVRYSLDDKNNIDGIIIDTDEISNKNLNLTFNYEYNNNGDWTKMSFYKSREMFDKSILNKNNIKSRLLEFGYTGFQLALNKYYMEATERVEFAKLYCSKTIIERNIEY